MADPSQSVTPEQPDRLADCLTCLGLLAVILLWVPVTILAPYIVMGVIALRSLDAHDDFTSLALGIVIEAVTGGLVGFLIGGLQWLLLRRWLPQSASWILMTSLAWGLGSGIAMVLFGYNVFDDIAESHLFAAGIVCGIALGLSQWRVLRGRFPYANWWPLVTLLAWVVGLYWAGTIWPHEYEQIAFRLISGFLFLALPSIFTFGGLCLLLATVSSKTGNKQ